MFMLDMNAFKRERHITNQLFFLGISLFLQSFLMNLCSSIYLRDDQSSTTSGASLMRNRFSGHLEPLFSHYRSTDSVVQLLSHSEENPLKTGGQLPPNTDDNFPDKPGQNLSPSVIWTNGKTTGNEPRIGKSPADSSSQHPTRSPGVDQREPDARSMADEGCSDVGKFFQQNTIRNWDKKAPISTWENTNGQKPTVNEKYTESPEHRSLKNLHSDVLIAAPSSSSQAASSVDPNRRTHAKDALVSGHVPPALVWLRRLSRAIRNQHLPMAKDEDDALLTIDSDKLDSICSGPIGTESQQVIQNSGSKLSSCDELRTFSVDPVNTGQDDNKAESPSAVTSTEKAHGIEIDAEFKNLNELGEFQLFDEKIKNNLEDFNDSSIVNTNKTKDHASNGMGFRTGIDWIKGNQNAFVDPYGNNHKYRLLNTSHKLQQVLNTSKPLTWLYSVRTSNVALSSKFSEHLAQISTNGVVSDSYDDGRSSSVAVFNQLGQVINSNVIDELTTVSYDDALRNVYSTTPAGFFQRLLFKSTERYENERSSPQVSGGTTLKDRQPLQTPALLSPNRTDTTSAQELYARNSINCSLETNNSSTHYNRISQSSEENCLVESRAFLEISGWKFAFQSINFISSILFVAACGYSALGALLATKQLKTPKTCNYQFWLNCLLLLLCLCQVISGVLCGAWTSEFYESLLTKVLLSVTRICFTLSFLVHCLSVCKLFGLIRRCCHSVLYFASVGIAVFFFLVDIFMKIFLPKCAVTTFLSTELLWMIYCVLSASVFGMHIVSFRRKVQSISRYWIETELDADSKETVFSFANLVSRGLRFTNISATLGLCLLLVNICDIGFRYYGQRQHVRAVMSTAISNVISVAYCFTLAISCRRLQTVSEERGSMKCSESCSAVSIACDSTTLTKSSLSLSRGRTLDNISSLLYSEHLVFASSSKFRSKTLSRGDVRSGDSRTRNSESLPLNNRNSDGILIQRSLADGAVQDTIGHGYHRDSKKRSMLFNDNGFIRFRKESDPDDWPYWSDANAATSDDSTDCQMKTTPMLGNDIIDNVKRDDVIRDGVIDEVIEDDVIGGISDVIQQPKTSRPGNESENGGSLHMTILQRILNSRSRSLANSQSSTPLGSRRSCRSSAFPSPNLSGYRLPLIHLQESIDRALNDLSLKQVDADSISKSMI